MKVFGDICRILYTLLWKILNRWCVLWRRCY